jgi:serine/threonine-protein kinase
MSVPRIDPKLDRDERLAQLLAGLGEDHWNNRGADVEAVARQHPELGQELRELWAAFLVAEEMGRSVDPSRLTLHVPGPLADAASPSLTLPRSFGDYELLEELGRGGMGVVYKARQKTLDRLVAVKMILRGELASGVDLARFHAEAESAARLEHPNIVSIFEVGEQEGQAYFTMQYVEGTTLARRVAAGPLPPRDAAHYLVEVCLAIHHAHQHGILHRDLKPSNVLIDRSGRALVTDFGLAKRVTARGGDGVSPGDGQSSRSLTHTGAILGTPSYMAPEQAAGSRGVLGPASDVYSLGTILYEMLTGRPPFQASSALDTLLLVLEQEPVPPRLLNRGVDRTLEMVCLKCLQKPAELRYPTAARLADDLQAYLQGEPVSAQSVSLTDTLSRLLGETHHAVVLENWGLLWMWHSLAILTLCCVTNWMHLRGVESVYPYLGLWAVGLGTWASIFLALRRRGGPVTFVERQIVHVWAGSTACSTSLFVVERLLALPVLTLSPVLGLIGAMVFLVKASVLSGSFYIWAGACFAAALVMAIVPDYGLFVFGVVSAAGFFFPGLKYYRQHLAGDAEASNRVDGRLSRGP